MTFQQLRYLLEVYNTGSFSKAADNLYVSRPSISLSISSLEAELGYPIFIRSQHGLALSAQGEQVIKYASSICQAQQNIKNIRQKSCPRIRIHTVKYEPVNRAVLRLLDENKNRNDITFSFNANFGVHARAVALSNVDIALSAKFEAYNSEVDSQLKHWNLHREELGKLPMVICIGPGHRLYHKSDITPDDFRNDVLLDTTTRALSRCESLRDIIPINPEKVISLTSYPALKNKIIAQGLAYAIRKQPTDNDIRQYGLRCIPLDGVYQRMICITSPNRPLAPEAQRFIELVKEELKNYSSFFPTY